MPDSRPAKLSATLSAIKIDLASPFIIIQVSFGLTYDPSFKQVSISIFLSIIRNAISAICIPDNTPISRAFSSAVYIVPSGITARLVRSPTPPKSSSSACLIIFFNKNSGILEWLIITPINYFLKLRHQLNSFYYAFENYRFCLESLSDNDLHVTLFANMRLLQLM